MFTLKTASNFFSIPSRENSGFSLLEIMISVSIIALIFTSLFRMQSGTIGLASKGKFNRLAPALAQRLLVNIEQDLANWSESEGDFGEALPGIKWTCLISDAFFEENDLVSEENYKQFKRIDIKIRSTSGQQSYNISTWRFVIE